LNASGSTHKPKDPGSDAAASRPGAGPAPAVNAAPGPSGGRGPAKNRTTAARTLFWIVLAAVAIRLAFALFLSGFTGDGLPDTVRYSRVATALLEGKGFAEYGRRPTAFVPPVYPAFLAGCYGLFGFHALPVKILQALLGGLLSWIVFAAGRRGLGEKTALVAAAWTAVYPELVVLSGYLYTETLFILAEGLTFLFLLAGFRDGRTRNWIGAGFWLGVSVLIRNLLLFFPPFLMLACLIVREHRKRWRGIAAMTAVAAAVILPWTARNARAFHEFIPVTTGGGTEFYIGSDVARGGRYRHGESLEAINGLTRDAKTETEKDRILQAAALRNIRSRPLGYVRVCLGKAFRTVFQVYENVPTGKPRRASALVLIVLALFYYPLLGLTIRGLWITRAQARLWLPVTSLFAYCVLLYAAVHFVPRYRIPLIPFMILFGSAAAVSAAERIAGRFSSRRVPWTPPS
jgi:4-amino-4-deoxy-L-arabinose transferase-like glycosyltransferase